jgi:hypothetical protein
MACCRRWSATWAAMQSTDNTRALVVWRKNYTKARKPPKAFRTICEVLRELYRDAEARGDVLSMQRIDECTDMAKRMDSKLRQSDPSHGQFLAGGGYMERKKA